MKILLSLLFVLMPCFACVAQTNHAQWNAAIEAFEASDRANSPPQNAVLFIGSSSIEHWKTVTADFPEVKVINRGFGGSELSDSTYFADRIIKPYHPRAIVLYAGDNDLWDGRTPQQVRDDFEAFVRKVRSFDPGVAIAFVAIKPSMARKALLPKIRQANELVRKYAETQKNIAYIDVFTPMLGADGQPQPKWFIEDGLHMNRQGYQLWIGILKSWVDAHGR
jgi:lysophospholipase L1-like esterase